MLPTFAVTGHENHFDHFDAKITHASDRRCFLRRAFEVPTSFCRIDLGEKSRVRYAHDFAAFCLAVRLWAVAPLLGLGCHFASKTSSVKKKET
jgi:hypothetical protein